MKKLSILVILLAAVVTSNAQDKKWNIGFGGGFASPMGSDFKEVAKIGIDYYLNGTYNFTENLAAGLEYNGTGLVGASVGDGVKAGATSVSAFLAKGVYYFTKTSVKPYGSLMLGSYSVGVAATSIPETAAGEFESESMSKTNFGFGAELGLKIKWFNLSVSYHNAGKIEDVAISYMQYNIGFNIGF